MDSAYVVVVVDQHPTREAVAGVERLQSSCHYGDCCCTNMLIHRNTLTPQRNYVLDRRHFGWHRLSTGNYRGKPGGAEPKYVSD